MGEDVPPQRVQDDPEDEDPRDVDPQLDPEQSRDAEGARHTSSIEAGY